MESDFNTRIAALKKEVAELEAERAALEAMAPDEQLAVTLHSMLCRQNHTDGCGWHYHIKGNVHDWATSDHHGYLQKARVVLQFCNKHSINPEVAINLIKVVNR